MKSILSVKKLNDDDSIKSIDSVPLKTDNPEGFCGTIEQLKIHKNRLVGLGKVVEKLNIIKDEFKSPGG